MSPFALKEKDEGEWDCQKQRNVSLPPPWVHWEADLLKMVYNYIHLTVCDLDHYFIKAIMFLRVGLTSKLSVKRHSTRFYYFSWMPMSLWDKTITFSGLSAHEERNWPQCLFCFKSQPCPEPWAASQMPPSLPADRLHRQAGSCSIQLAEQTYLQGCSTAMQEAMAKALACGQEASTVLRPLLADSKDMSTKSS